MPANSRWDLIRGLKGLIWLQKKEEKENQYVVVDNWNIYKHCLKLIIRTGERNKCILKAIFKVVLLGTSDGTCHADRDFVDGNGPIMPGTFSLRKRNGFKRPKRVNDGLRHRTRYVVVCTKNTLQVHVLPVVTSVISLTV